jgi:hypothetical protein
MGDNNRPSVKLRLTQQWFNNLITSLENHKKILETANDNNEWKLEIEETKRLIDKLLKYTVIREISDGTIYADIRLFSDEAARMIVQLSTYCCYLNADNMYDYFNDIKIKADAEKKLKTMKK